MNIEFVPADQLRQAESLLEKGDGESLRKGAMLLLMNKCQQKGENCSSCLNAILKKLTQDPYQCLGIPQTADAKDVKRAYRKLALQVHPDKNENKTSVLFAAVQGSYVVLNDQTKRKQYDTRCQNREKHKQANANKSSKNHRRPPSTNSFHVPPQSTADAKHRDFNRNFYNEYRRNAYKRPPPPSEPPSEPQTSSSSSSSKMAPPKPIRLRTTDRTDTTVTLEWQAGRDAADACAASKAYELQWRIARSAGETASLKDNWETGQQLILRSACRKRNLRPASSYEFRVRAASVSGWSPYSDTLTVLTLPDKVAENCVPSAAAASIPKKTKRPTSAEKHKDRVQLPKVVNKNQQDETWWQCVVCKRSNAVEAAKCAVCGTNKDYDWGNNEQHERSRRTAPKSSTKTPRKSSLSSKGEDEEDDDYGVDLGGTWTFTDKDVPEKYNAYDDIDQWMDDAVSRPNKESVNETTKQSLWLNPTVTSMHNVRREPIKNSPVVGHLVADTEIQVLAETGNWVKCKCHKTNKAAGKNGRNETNTSSGEGWCLSYDDEHQYIVKDSYAYPSRRESSEDDEEVIYELRDEDNHLYYFNSYTGVSMWEPPEIDPTSGAVYYTHSKTAETQWERPFDFVPIVREELYSTPQAKFIKSILSPKRSQHNIPSA